MKGPPLDPGGEDITWPAQLAPRGRKASSTRKIKPQTLNPMLCYITNNVQRRNSGIINNISWHIIQSINPLLN